MESWCTEKTISNGMIGLEISMYKVSVKIHMITVQSSQNERFCINLVWSIQSCHIWTNQILHHHQRCIVFNYWSQQWSFAEVCFVLRSSLACCLYLPCSLWSIFNQIVSRSCFVNQNKWKKTFWRVGVESNNQDTWMHRRYL